MAEIELNVLIRQCISQRIANIETFNVEIAAYQNVIGNEKNTMVFSKWRCQN